MLPLDCYETWLHHVIDTYTRPDVDPLSDANVPLGGHLSCASLHLANVSGSSFVLARTSYERNTCVSCKSFRENECGPSATLLWWALFEDTVSTLFTSWLMSSETTYAGERKWVRCIRLTERIQPHQQHCCSREHPENLSIKETKLCVLTTRTDTTNAFWMQGHSHIQLFDFESGLVVDLDSRLMFWRGISGVGCWCTMLRGRKCALQDHVITMAEAPRFRMRKYCKGLRLGRVLEIFALFG